MESAEIIQPKKQSLAEKLGFISDLDKNKDWIHNSTLVEKFFSDGEELVENIEFIEKEMYNPDNSVWDMISDKVYTFLNDKDGALLLEHAIKCKGRFPLVAGQIIFIYLLQFEIRPDVLEDESLVKLLLKNIKNEDLWPILDKFIMAIFDERVDSHAVELIKKFESDEDSILDRGIFIDLVNAKVESHLFDFQYLQNIRSVLEKIVKASDVSYFLKIKCIATLSKINSILKSQTQEIYDNETEKINESLFVSESESEEGEDAVSSNGFNFSAEYALIMANMPGFILPEEQKESEEWNYLKKTCGEEIEKDFGELFFDISSQEQKQFLDFVKKKKDFNIEDIRDFCKKYGRSGFLTFLSLEFGTDMGDKIIGIGKNINEEDVKLIFNKYAELIAQTDKIEGVLNDVYGIEKGGGEVFKIKEAILKKAKDLLVHFVDLLSQGNEISSEKIIDHLKRIEAEATTFFLTFKTLKEEKQLLPLEEIKGISFEKLGADEVSPEDKASMRELYEENYKEDPEFLDELLAKFEERSNDPTTRFYILKYLGKLKASIAFTPDKKREGVVYGHSFNVEPSLRGISIGNTMLEKAKDQEAKENILTSDCAAFEPIGAKNIETGYVANKFYLYKGHPSFFVERDDKNNGKYWGKSMSGKEDEIVGLSEKGQLPDGVRVQSGNEQKDVSMELVNQGYLLTRYFKDTKSGKWYGVFEKV